MSGINAPKTLVRLWAAVYSDFESLIAKFMQGRTWHYVHFAELCREMQITLVLHMTQGRGKTKDEHYDRITGIIFQICKDLWLPPGGTVKRMNKCDTDNQMELKRALGGFYLLYTLYEKQPVRDRVKIPIGVKDMAKFVEFISSIRILPFVAQVRYMIKYLIYKQAFHNCLYSEDFRFDTSTRYFLNCSKSEVVDLTRRMRDEQDVLAYSTIHHDSETTFATTGASKNAFAKDMLKTIDPVGINAHIQNRSAYHQLVKTLPTEIIGEAFCRLDKIVDKPILTLQTLTATEAIDRRMTVETHRRMERARKKAVQSLDRDGERKAIRPYVREGGIFGRKKEIDETDEPGKRRERGACNGNLWIYINGCDFDKPMGEPRRKPPPVPHTSAGHPSDPTANT